MKKLALLLIVFVVVAVIAEAQAGPLPGPMRLFWADNDGDPNDSRVIAAPGETVFIQLLINSGSNQGNGASFFLDADWDPAVVASVPVAGQYVTVDTTMYMMFRDYQNPGGSSWNYTGVEVVSYGAGLDTLNIDFNGPGNLYPYGNGGAEPGPTGETGTPGALTASQYFSTIGSGGVIAGFWVPIRADAVVGSTTRFDVNVNSSGLWGGGGWDSALTAAGNEHGTDWLSAGAADFSMIITVVPEPATMSLLAIGGIGALIRRKK